MLITDLILCLKFIRNRFKTIQDFFQVRYLPSKCQQDEVFKKMKGFRQRNFHQNVKNR